jgi:flavodoxin
MARHLTQLVQVRPTEQKGDEVMKGTICYYSGSGNTKLACEYLARYIQDVEFDFIDAIEVDKPDLSTCDIMGFATFTDFFAPAYGFQAFLEELPPQEGKPAFVFNTYGTFSGKTLKVLEKKATDKGFDVIAGHSLHTPESYPPLNAMGITSEESPSEKELGTFDRFIDQLAANIRILQAGGKLIRMAFTWDS